MLFLFFRSAHQRACATKQAERQSKIESLSPVYSSPLSSSEEKIHALSLSELVTKCRSGAIQPSSIMMAYAKKALFAHKATNCLADLMFDEALATSSVANWGPGVDSDAGVTETIRERSLMGVPISIKETIDIEGHDSTISFSRNIGQPSATSSSIVRLLQDAGALIHVKTTVPTGLISIETISDIYGRTTNPYNHAHTAGASTGGGGALVACGGSKIEIGTDIAGSVRIPAHFCGVWSLKGSAGRFPSWGNQSSLSGLESIPIVISPLANNLTDLREFCQRLVSARPWHYDHTCVPLPWHNVNLQDEGRKLKWGVIWDDGTIPPTPACKRALSTVIAALKKQGHEVVDFHPPDVFEGLKIGYQLLFSDGGAQIRNALQPGENVSAPTKAILDLLNLPRLFKKILSFFLRSRDPVASQLYDIMHVKTVVQDRGNVAARDRYRAAWHQKWTEEGLDFVLTVPIAFPALENDTSEKATLMSAGYTFLFSLLDYTTGSLPVTYVDKALDGLPENFTKTEQYRSFSASAKGAYSIYDAEKMHGLPLGIQIAGRRLEEEKVLEGMQIIEAALHAQGTAFINKVNL
ncbi:amidase signature domain-containing protein [Gymnopilus junonius]|uniref:Amidase signature domain-containing protein n=1 Tax=Gymnopilus junonius TaxID=109634 RepID=A0A9P5NXA0_GYMJU|nr:amidase signature domain-containing protein [Gymnopilus junonius]